MSDGDLADLIMLRHAVATEVVFRAHLADEGVASVGDGA